MSTRRPTAPRAPRGAARPVSRPPADPARRTGSRPARGHRPTAERPGPDRPRADRSAAKRRGQSRDERRTARRARGDEPRPTLTLRALGLTLVALVAFIVLAPTLRYAVAQQEDLRELNADLAEARERTSALEEDLALWEDPDYIRAQARDRLGYVAPGETPYVVIDPETVVGEDTEAARTEDEAARQRLAGPWYLTVLQSVQVAGELPADGAPAESQHEPLILPEVERP